MSTRLNVTSNLFGLSNALGLEKSASSLLRQSLNGFVPTMDRLKDMQRLIARAPKAGNALSPTNMTKYLAENADDFKTLFSRGSYIGRNNSQAIRFANSAANKSQNLANLALRLKNRYIDRIATGGVDPLDPATLERLSQLTNRYSKLNDAAINAALNASAIRLG